MADICIRCRRSIADPDWAAGPCDDCPCCDWHQDHQSSLAEAVGLCADCEQVVTTTLLPEVRSALMAVLQ